MTATVHERLPFSKYCELPGESASGLRRFIRSPLEYRWFADHEQPETDAMRQGSATHAAVLEPAVFASDFVTWDGGVRRGREWDRFVLEHEPFGRRIITQTQRDNALAVAKAVRAHPRAAALLAEPGKPELSVVWTHKRSGIQMKARIDWLCSALVDLKTTANIEPRLFSGQVARLGIHVQLAVYRAACLELGLDLPTKLIVAQSGPPYDVVVFSVGDAALMLGEQLYETALDRLLVCRSTGQWPGLAANEEIDLHLPGWAHPDYDDDASWGVSSSEVA